MLRYMVRLLTIFAFVITLADAVPPASAASGTCRAPQPVCAMAKRVVMISAFDPLASAVLIDQGLLVTNRHVIADQTTAEVRMASGTTLKAQVIPSGFVRDLILLRVDGLADAPPLEFAQVEAGATLYVIGADVGRNAVRVYAPGNLLAAPVKDAPKSRIHHDAQSFPGNSGGALVDANGRLVGIATSGGEGRNEAIPAIDIDRLRQLSTPKQFDHSRTQGIAYRKCATGIEMAQRTPGKISNTQADTLMLDCRRTGNRQYFDLLGRLFGERRLLERSTAMLRDSLAMDPMAPNALMSIVVVLHLRQRYWDEIPYLRRLLTMLPTDPQVLRLAIQAGTWGGDEAFASDAMDLLEQHHPNLAPAARRFLDNPPPTPGTPRPR